MVDDSTIAYMNGDFHHSRTLYLFVSVFDELVQNLIEFCYVTIV